MSKDGHGHGPSELQIPQAQAGITYQVHSDEPLREQDHEVQLLAMEELVPISQTLFTPALARLFNMAVPAPSTDHEQILRPLPQAQRSLLHPHDEGQLQQVAINACGKEDLQDSAEDLQHADSLQMMMMMGTFMEDTRDSIATPHKRSHVDAGLMDSYGANDSTINDHGEGFGTNHVADRENSSNSGDGGAGSAGGGGAGGSGSGGGGARTLKRPRLVWTPQLHKRFVDAVSHLGIKNAVPKTIMQLMNVEGLTRENVASHLQKYRLYLRRVQQGNLFSSCNGGAVPSTQSIMSSPGSGQHQHQHHHHHHQLIAGAPPSPRTASSDHHQLRFNSSFSPLNQYISHPSLHQRRRPAAATSESDMTFNPLIPSHGLLLHQPHHQLKPGNTRASMVKTPPFSTRLHNGSTVDPSLVKRKSPWLSPGVSVDMNVSPHRLRSHGDHAANSSKASSPPKRALTLFPH